MLRRKSPMKRAIVTPDKHFPYHDEAAINVLCKAIRLDALKSILLKVTMIIG